MALSENILITGSSGFVGKNLFSYLRKSGYETIGVSRSPKAGVDVDYEQLENVALWKDTLSMVHLAGKAHDTANTSAAEEYFKVNRDLTIQLFDKFLESETKDFFYFSSVKAVADRVKGVLEEEVNGKPLTPYGQSKLEAEQYLLEQSLPEGKRLFIIRPCMIHGPGNKGNLNLLYKVVEKGLPWPLASFHNQRSFLSIDNLSYLIEQMILSPNVESGVYNFADDESLSTNELVALIAKTVGKKPKLLHIPAGLVKGGVKFGDILPLPLNSERLKKLTESYVVSNAKIKKALGIEKLPVTAQQGLEKTILSFKQ